MKPLVSILIPAYNAEKWVAATLQSAIAQTWPRKEIVLVNDGSTDRTAEVAQQFTSMGVVVVSTKNEGAAAARNQALQLSRGDYIQWLDADDLLAPDKIERQLAAAREGDSRRILFSCSWAPFYYRTRHTHVVRNSLCEDLRPVEWLLRKMSENLHMQTATWLTSRELVEAAGLWDTRLLTDDDGDYFRRVVMASTGTRFVPDATVFYRVTSRRRLSYIGGSDKKKDAMALSLRLHIESIRSLEESERVRNACLRYLQNWYGVFYPERPDLTRELQGMAAQLGGGLEIPRLPSKYGWLEGISGRKAAKWAQNTLPYLRIWFAKQWDHAMYRVTAEERVGSAAGVTVLH
jgi:glycosyltransferase involved in cell wall biosynthesis